MKQFPRILFLPFKNLNNILYLFLIYTTIIYGLCLMIEENNLQANNTNASAAAFGWDFQRNAAILLMLKNIKAAKSVRVEGLIEDIEIRLNDGTIIYSQAKSIQNINSTQNTIAKLRAALKTLNRASEEENVKELIYITNIPDPMKDDTSRNLFWGYSIVSFSDLTIASQNRIKEIIANENYTIDTNKLRIVVVPFFGDDDSNRYKIIKEQVSDFLSNCNIQDIAIPQEIMQIWQNHFFINATHSDQKFNIEKEDMIWAIIAYLCSFERCRNDSILDECDNAMIREIERTYNQVINNKSEDFEFFNRVLADYNKFEVNLKRKERVEKFINGQYIDYEQYFQVNDIDDETKSCLIKLVIKKIIDNRLIMDDIKRGAGL